MSAPESKSQKKIEILECTLRDGSYPVNFKFTLQDTALLAKLLCDVGFKYIEVAHGVGLGAVRAGKGQTPWPDEEAVRVAKSTIGDKALVGVFCIAGIATFDDMKRAVDAGLDFIRIAQNASDIDMTIPYIKEAVKLGIMPVVNFMKSYSITPQDFGEKAKMVANEGAQIVYVVDSAGGMFPQQIVRYFNEIRKKTDIKMGLHAHNNLHLAVANSIEAVRHGASFIDGTLYGLGRSAGNAPTEVLIATMENLGYETPGIDLFRVMDIAEAYMKPLINQVQMYDMMAVTAGYSLFHSSYLPKVVGVAKQYGLEPRRLAAAMGKTDSVNCPDDVLENLARKLSKEKIQAEEQKDILISFSALGISPQNISNTMKAVEVLIDGLVVSSGKRQCASVLDLFPTHVPEDDMVLAEFLIDDYDAVLGRVHFGSEKMLEDILLLAKDKVARVIVDIDANKWINPFQISEKVRKVWKTNPVCFYSSFHLEYHHLLNVIGCAAKQCGGEGILLFGDDRRVNVLLPEIENLFERIIILGDVKIPRVKEEKLLQLPASEAELRHINIKANVVLCSSFTSAETLAGLLRLVRPDGIFISIPRFVGINLAKLSEREDISIICVDFADAYRGLISRISRIESAMSQSRRYVND